MATAEISANQIFFKDFCLTLEQLQKKKKSKAEQDTTLVKFINECKLLLATVSGKKSFFPLMRLLLPNCERERSPYNLKQTKLSELLVKVLSLSKLSEDAKKLLNYRAVDNAGDSDFAGVAYFVLRSRVGQKPSNLTIGDINKVLDKIATAEVGNKGPALDEAFTYIIRKLPAEQIKWFLRIVLKDLKISMGTNRILAALHPDAPDYYENCGNLAKVCEELEDGDSRPVELGIQMFYACSPMLSERLDVTKLSGELSTTKNYQIEMKFDGERFQMHMEDNRFEYYSKKGYSYSDNYGKDFTSGLVTPFLKDCFSPSVTSFILDGEMMGWHKHRQALGSKGEAFDVKKISERSNFRPCFCAFDILYYNGLVLAGPAEKAGIPLKERLKLLDSMVTDIPGVIMKSKRQNVNDWSDILNALNKAMEDLEEGLIVKDIDSYYMPNKRNGGWYKIKPEYTASTMSDLDLVIIGADEAENKSQGRARSFYVACADAVSTEAQPHRWVCIGKVATGLKHEVRMKLCDSLQRRWVSYKTTLPPQQLVFNRKKPDYWILPQDSTVLQIRATELVRSSDFGTPYTLRFPRIVKLRDDKPVNNSMTLDEFNKLVEDKGPVAKLSRNQVDQSQMEVEVQTKRRTVSKPQVPEHLKPVVSDVNVTSQALIGREVCVLSSDEHATVNDLVQIVLKHGGKHVANPGPKTWCCVAGKVNVRVNNIIKAQTYDIVKAEWLRSLPDSKELCSLCPLDMLSMKQETRIKISVDYDQFGDSYTSLLDESTLRRIFDYMDKKGNKIYLTKEEILEIDNELYDGDKSHSFLRPYYIHFTKFSIDVIKARKYGATLCDINDPNLTHVIVEDDIAKEVLKEINEKAKGKVFDKSWIEKCFESKKLVTPESSFM